MGNRAVIAIKQKNIEIANTPIKGNTIIGGQNE